MVGTDDALPVFDEEKGSWEVKYNELLALYEQEKTRTEQATQQLAATQAQYKACYEQLGQLARTHSQLLQDIAALVEKYKN